METKEEFYVPKELTRKHYETGCKNKRKFCSEYAARFFLDAHNFKNNGVYKCKFCSSYHTTGKYK